MSFSFHSKEHKMLHQWFFELIQNIWKTCNDIHEVDFCHMHSMLLALALLLHKTANHYVLPDLITGKRVLPWNTPHSISSAKHFPLHLSNAYHTAKYIDVSLIAGFYIKKYQRGWFACYCYQKLRQTNFFKKNFGKCSHIGCFKGRNSNWKTLTTSNVMLQNKSLMEKIIGNLAHKSL